MIGAAVCIRGFEDIAKMEIESLGAKKAKALKGAVTFEADALLLAKAAYMARTTSRVFALICSTKIENDLKKTAAALENKVDKAGLPSWISSSKSFKVECERTGEHNFTSQDFEAELGRIIIENIKKSMGFSPKVSLDNPDIIIYSSIIDDNCLFGIDFCGFDTSKRDYHIFTNRTAIKGTVAASLVFFGDIPPKKVLLDPFCSSGTIAIEAAMISEGMSVHSFRKEGFAFKKLEVLKNTDWNIFFGECDRKRESRRYRIIGTDPVLANVNATVKNAKIAGVFKLFEVSRVDIDWLDTKIDKDSVDFIITKLPSASKTFSEKDAKKLYKEFFYQAEYVLKKGGRMVALLTDKKLLLDVAKNYKFGETSSKEIMIGKMPAKVVMLKQKAVEK